MGTQGLNQMTSSQLLSASSAPPRVMIYSPDGGIAGDGDWLYAYDDEDRLLSVTPAVPANGALRMTNAYDYRSRRIAKTVERYSDGD